MSDEAIMGRGPAKPQPPDREALKRWKLTSLRGAVWEASQCCSYDEIREHVEKTLAEIESDEP